MELHENIPLKNYTTMRLGGNARYIVDVRSVADIEKVITAASERQLSLFVLGGGSNTIARDEGFSGLVMRNRLMGIEVGADSPSETQFRVGAGENWDELVEKTVQANLSGIEALSKIPGTVGAAPVQNIGAYGQEVADVIASVEAYDINERRLVALSPQDCGFKYRHSIFRGEAAGRYVITAVTINLTKNAPQPPFYAALEKYFTDNNITIFTPQAIRDAVSIIRADKLPDPAELPNSGSFFKNAIIDDWLRDELLTKYPDMPSYDMPDRQYKIPTGWLIEQTGLKGKTLHGMKVHDKNALVLINQSAGSYADLDAARSEIQNAVRDKFRISIEQEPLEL